MVVLMFQRWRTRFTISLLLLTSGAVGLILLAAEQEEPDRVIHVVAERFTFIPSQIKLKKGEVVEIRIRSLDTNHGFRISEAGINVIVPKRGKGDARILFRAQERGSFPFECSKACGAGHTMMRGRIVVE